MKAVILAGGKGTRLMPLTSDIPKPLVMLGNKPILFHILDTAQKQGVTEVILTLGYLGEKIEEALKDYKTDLKISFSYEKHALGTAGAVKNAAKNIKEDFIVLSGDAYCEFDLKRLFDFHKRNNAVATVCCTKVNDPREYGLVLTDENGRITRFLEKPGWSQAVTDRANTGVYVLSEAALDFIPDSQQFDFSKNLFPLLLKKKLPVFSFDETGYWCDVGEIESYIKCNSYLLSKMPKNDSVPRGKFDISDFVYIGKNVKIGNNVKIKKYSVICDGVTIGENSVIDSCVIYPGARIGSGCRAEKAVVCANAKIEDDVRLNPFSCVGSSSSVGKGTVLYSSVHIAKNKKICGGLAVVRSVTKDMETDRVNDVSNSFIPDVDPFFALELGCALGTALEGGKIAVATDSSQKSVSVLYSLMSGLQQTGAQVWSFGESFKAQMAFYTYFCSLPVGVFIKTSGENVSISLSATGGLPLKRDFERKLSSILKTKDYCFASEEKVKHAVEMQSVNLMYSSVLFRQSESSLSKIKVNIDTDNEKISLVLGDCIRRLEGEIGDGITIHISNDGTEISVTENNIEYSREKILSALLFYETKSGRDVSLSFFSPPVYSAMASLHTGNVVRYCSSSADGVDENAREKARGQLWTRDALFMAVRLLSLMHEEGKTLSFLLQDVPDFYLSKGEAAIDFSPTALFGMFSDMENVGTPTEGITFIKNGAKAIVLPDTDGKKVKILTESFESETAKDLCSEIIDRISSFHPDGGT